MILLVYCLAGVLAVVVHYAVYCGVCTWFSVEPGAFGMEPLRPFVLSVLLSIATLFVLLTLSEHRRTSNDSDLTIQEQTR